MRDAQILLTGFEPYGGRGLNPAAMLAEAIDGSEISGHTVCGAVLPVTLNGLHERLAGLIGQLEPALVVCLGLNPGESAIRLERFGVNLADFEIPDNGGERPVEMPLSQNEPAALTSTLPLRAIRAALLDQGLPAHISNSAGTYLCNAALFAALSLTRNSRVPTGFIHLPYLPAQVALLLQTPNRESSPAGPPPSMALETMETAVRLALTVALKG